MIEDVAQRMAGDGALSDRHPQRPALVAMDVDGTIAGADHGLSPYTVRTLRRLRARGVAGVIVTGRAEGVALAIARELGFTAPVISCNGAVITDPVTGERLRVRQMEPEASAHAVQVARRLGCSPTLWTPDAWFADEESPTTDLLTHLLAEAPRFRTLADVIAAEKVVKVMVGGDPDHLDRVEEALRAQVPGLARSMPQFCEVGPPDATKLEAIAFVLDALGIAIESAWGFGDSDNDVGWLGLLGRAIAPANALPGVRAIAHEVIGHHAEDSVAAYVEEQILGSG
jgi:Cof subfamily protein (haloacid dehalogenase superfamily)